MTQPSALPATINLTAYRGDTWAQPFRFLNGGAPVDFTDKTVACEARDHGGNVLTLDVAGDADGYVTLRLPAGSVPPNTYTYDIEVTDVDGNVATWVRGSLYVQRDVTHELP